MSETTIEGIVKNGQIILPKEFKLPESTRVYVVVPQDDVRKRVFSPKLANKADSKIFEKKVEADIDDEI